MFNKKQGKCVIYFLMMTLFLLSILPFNYREAKAAESSQISPNITWAQGGLEALRWGMSKEDVERVLGVRLRRSYYDRVHHVEQYTTNLTTTWIRNTRISFSCKYIASSMSFHRDKLISFWFCADKSLINTLSSKFGPGRRVSHDKDQREWRDDETEITVGRKYGSVMITDWRKSDKVYGR